MLNSTNKLKISIFICFLTFSILTAGCGTSNVQEQSANQSDKLQIIWTGNEGSLAKPSDTAWSFGVMSDTQWGLDDGYNPNSVSVAIINQLNKQFISNRVKFVIQVGDLSDSGSIAGTQTRALFAQPLYNAEIGFFPLRGNHDDQPNNLAEYKRIFPQTMDGIQNATPSNLFKIYNPDATSQPFPTKTGSSFTIGKNFSSPSSDLSGLSYSFDYSHDIDSVNARFIMLDQFRIANGYQNTIDDQQKWINSRLEARPANSHAFVFGHKGLITTAHVDTLFGSDPSQDSVGQNTFIKSLNNNNVHFYTHGHDHIYDRSIVTTTDLVTAKIQQITCASNSSKFLQPAIPSNDMLYNLTGFGHLRQTPLSQESYSIGFLIYTIDGPRVTVDYYSALASPFPSYEIFSVPFLIFSKRETFGYSLNGKEFLINQGATFTTVIDAFKETKARIINGTNNSKTTDGSGRPFTIAINTGWTHRSATTASDIITLWGMEKEFGLGLTANYVFSMSYDPKSVSKLQIQNGQFGLATPDASGNWINAVNQNFGGKKSFVFGPYSPQYTLGTYGVDSQTNTVWAVINYNSDFAAALFP
jgi:hypothetical protein